MNPLLWLSDLLGGMIKKHAPGDLAQALSRHMSIVKPDGPGPFPVVLQFHGCGGLVAPDGSRQPIMDEYASVLLEAGMGVVSVESFPHRKIGRREALDTVCTGAKFRGAERAGDVLVALDHVRNLPWVDATRIGLAGWSHGGWSIMDLLAMDLTTTKPHNLKAVPPGKLDGVVGVHLTYPWSGTVIALTPNRGWAHTPKTRVVMASEDSIAPGAGTLKAIERMREAGAQVDVRVFEGLDHAFDERFQEPGSDLVFVEEAAETAREEYAAWFAAVFALDLRSADLHSEDLHSEDLHSEAPQSARKASR